MRRLADRWWLVGSVLALAVLAATAVLLNAAHMRQLQHRAASQAEALATLRGSVDDVLGREAGLARAVGVAESTVVSRWSVFAQSVMSQPLANSVAFIVPVSERDRVGFQRRTGIPLLEFVRPGVFHPVGPRPEYFVAEKLIQRVPSGAPLGVDIGVDPVRRGLLLASARTRKQMSSPPVSLISANDARGVVVYAPIYDPAGQLRGWVAATYEARGLAAMVAQSVPAARLTIRDGRSLLVGDGKTPSGRPGSLHVAGQVWQVWTSVPGAGFDAVPWLVFGLGFTLAAGVMLILRQAVVRERYASAQVAWHVGAERERQVELAEDRRALAEAQTIAGIGSWSVDPVTGETRWSEEMYRIFARDPADGPLLGRAMLDRLVPEDRAEVADVWLRARQSEDGFDLRGRLVDDGGHLVHLRALARREPDGRLSGTVQDVTQAAELREELATASARLQAVLEHSPMGIYMRDLEGRFVFANQEMASVRGTTSAELVGRTLEEVLDPAVAAGVRTHDEEVMSAGLLVRSQETRPAGGDEPSRTYLWQKFPVFDGDGHALGIGGIVQDMTAEIANERARRETSERFRAAFEEAPIGMAIIDFEGRLTQVNEALGVMLGYSRGEMEGMLARSFAHPDDNVESGEAMADMLAGRRTSYSAEKRYITAAGQSLSCALQASVLLDPDGQPRAVLSQIQDITGRKRHEAQLEHLADHDALTGLLNRRAFIRELSSHADRAARYGATGTVLMIDLDQFKFVNDTLGHHAGDELITRVAHLLRERLRTSDVLARLGGDEFAILLPFASPQAAEQVARSVIDALRREAISVAGTQRQISASVGVASFVDHPGLSAEDIMIHADLAMYEAKETGRDRFVTFRPGDRTQARMQGRVSWAKRITHALETDGFTLLAQPIVDLQTGVTTQYELLLRMHEDNGDLIPPATFLYIAERLNLMTDIDCWVTTQAIQMLATRPEVILEVNLSARSLGDPRLLELIEQQLRATQVAPERLIFEITETVALTSLTRAQSFGQHLSSLGCRFALDDFGAGFGSFYYLKHLVFDYLKIDGEFIRNCCADPTDQLVIEAVVDIARGMSKRTIAEFVGDEPTVALLSGLGVDYGQGYHLGVPAPLDEQLAALLASETA